MATQKRLSADPKVGLGARLHVTWWASRVKVQPGVGLMAIPPNCHSVTGIGSSVPSVTVSKGVLSCQDLGLICTLSLVSITRQTLRPRHKNKAIMRLSSHPSRYSLCFDSKLVVVVVPIGLMETRPYCQCRTVSWHFFSVLFYLLSQCHSRFFSSLFICVLIDISKVSVTVSLRIFFFFSVFISFYLALMKYVFNIYY